MVNAKSGPLTIEQSILAAVNSLVSSARQLENAGEKVRLPYHANRTSWPLLLQGPKLHLLQGVVTSARSHCHVGQRRVLACRGDHERAIRDEEILDVMRLIPRIQYRCFWIMPHTRAAHLVNAFAW